MRTTYRLSLQNAMFSLTAALVLAGAAAWAAATPPFEFSAFGSFKRMSHTGDASGQVSVQDLPQGPGTWGVGALAGLSGEILLHGGRLLISRGEDHGGAAAPAKPGDEAVLFAAARVRQWRDVRLTSDMSQAQFEIFVVAQAKAHGLDPDQPFPFLVEGRFPVISWHVVTGKTTDTAHRGAHANRHAGMKVFDQSDAAGRLVSIYSGAQFEGVVSHPGQRFHIHYVDDLLRTSGHVDTYRVARDSVLRLPEK